MGWWFKGPHGRKIAHIWPGADRIWRGYAFHGDENIPLGPFLTEEAAMNYIADELRPREVKP